MEQQNVDLDDGFCSEREQAESMLGIERCIQTMGHACRCRDDDCTYQGCKKIKRVLLHTEICVGKLTASCNICNQVVALTNLHVRHCQEADCLMPFCAPIKHRVMQERLLRSERVEPLEQGMAGMNVAVVDDNIGNNPLPPSTPPAEASPLLNGADPISDTLTGPSNVLQVAMQAQEDDTHQQ